MADSDAVPAPLPVSDTTNAVAVVDPRTSKRKREDEDEKSASQSATSRVKRVQNDILQVLARHDTQPSFLNHSLTQTSNANSTEPSQKKARLSDHNPNDDTIATKLSNASYTSLQQLGVDAGHVSEGLVSAIRLAARERDAFTGGRPSVEELKQIQRIQSLETLVKDIIDRESRSLEASEHDETRLKEDSRLTNHATNGRTDVARSCVGSALTLFGNAPTPKQLFSSLQNSSAHRKKPGTASELPVEEMSLPNGIAATKILSAPLDNSQKGPSLGSVSAPPYSLQPLQPPMAHKKTSTRDQFVTWEFKDSVQRNRKGGYTVQPLTTGTWLGYGGVEDADPTSPRAKRKQRERALSFSAGNTVRRPSKEISEDTLRKEEEALFRRAYSSFAPSHDNSNAVVPEETKNMVWWEKIGNKRFNDTFAIDPALLDATNAKAPILEPAGEVKEDEFDKVLQDLDELEQEELQLMPAKPKTDIDQVLREVSELLETLASHQRIRNASLPSTGPASRTPISPAPLAVFKSSQPDEPSEEETSTYETLRKELAYLLLKLPPYAVAKLDGDQLASLGVKQLITFEQKDIKGTMEEDQVTRQAKLAAMATANSIANLARPNSSAGQHYNTTAQRTPAIGQAANTRYGQQYAGRPPAQTPQFQRQTSNPSTFGAAASVSRPTYHQYNRPVATQPVYAQPNGQQYYQQRSAQTPGNQNYNHQYQPTPLQQRPNYGLSQPPQYSSRSQAAALSAVGYQNNTVPQRTVSPAKSGYATPIQQPVTQHRPMYPAPQSQQPPGSGRATPVSFVPQTHTPVNGFPAPPRPVQGLAPRPASSTPQPPTHGGPTLPPAATTGQTNGTS